MTMRDERVAQMKIAAAQNYVIETFKSGRLSPEGVRYHLDRLGMSSDFIDAVIASGSESE